MMKIFWKVATPFKKESLGSGNLLISGPFGQDA